MQCNLFNCIARVQKLTRSLEAIGYMKALKSMKLRRLVSVIVPTYNRPVLLREALASIRALEGDDLEFEILVCDNGLTAESKQATADWEAFYIPVEIKGAGAARNAGLKAATGEFIAFLDDDDIWAPGNIRPHIALFDAKPSLGAIFSQIVYTDADRVPIGNPWPDSLPDERSELLRKLLSGYYPQIGGTVIRSTSLRGAGEFDVSLIGDQDWDWQIRIAKAHSVGFVKVPAVFVRERPAGSFDELQLRRIPYSRQVFFRHAFSNLRIWKSPFDLWRGYRLTLWLYYKYFTDAGIERASRQEYRSALKAFWYAFYYFPVRTTRNLLSNHSARSAFRNSIFGIFSLKAENLVD